MTAQPPVLADRDCSVLCIHEPLVMRQKGES